MSLLCSSSLLTASSSPESSRDSKTLSAVELNNRGVTAAREGRFEEGVDDLRRAIELAPSEDLARKNLSGVLTTWAAQRERKDSVGEVIALLEEAVTLNAANESAWQMLGDLRYVRRSDFAGAVQAWQRAAEHAPTEISRGLADRIARAQRDQLIERGYQTAQTAHFEIRFQRARADDLAHLQELLEHAYQLLAREHGRGPSRLIVVIYPEMSLQRIVQNRDWAMGLYDGRIRLAFHDLAQAHLDDTVIHEVSHAFLFSFYPVHLPLWVHEGYAQFHESDRLRNADLEMRIDQGLRSRTEWVPLQWLDRQFEQPADVEAVARAYAEARLVVRELIARYGMERFKQFLEQLSAGATTESAYEKAFAPSRWARANQGMFD